MILEFYCVTASSTPVCHLHIDRHGIIHRMAPSPAEFQRVLVTPWVGRMRWSQGYAIYRIIREYPLATVAFYDFPEEAKSFTVP